MFLINLVGFLVVVFFVLCFVVHISFELDGSKVQKKCENFAADCELEIKKRFGISIRCYYSGYFDMSTDCEVPSIKCQLDINYRVMRAVLILKHFENQILTSVDVYKKSEGGEFKQYCQYSRKEYLDILIRNGYSFSVPENELYSAKYSSQEEKYSTESFICSASDLPVIRWCENEDFLRDFLK